MRIAIIHLCDLHISSKDAIHMEKVNALAQSLYVLLPFEGIIFAIAGDVAANGISQEYNLAEKFIGSILGQITKRYNISSENIKILIVPGNHDINNNNSGPRSREDVVAWYKQDIIESKVSSELSRMSSFYSFAKKYYCFCDEASPCLSRKILTFVDKEKEKHYIEANLLNSAPFSSSNDNGIHFMPISAIESYSSRKKY